MVLKSMVWCSLRRTLKYYKLQLLIEVKLMANKRTIFDSPTASRSTSFNMKTLSELDSIYNRHRGVKQTKVLDLILRNGLKNTTDEEIESLE